MTSHELARLLLNLPDLPVVTTEQESRGALDPWPIGSVEQHPDTIEIVYVTGRES